MHLADILNILDFDSDILYELIGLYERKKKIIVS